MDGDGTPLPRAGGGSERRNDVDGRGGGSLAAKGGEREGTRGSRGAAPMAGRGREGVGGRWRDCAGSRLREECWACVCARACEIWGGAVAVNGSKAGETSHREAGRRRGGGDTAFLSHIMY